jgi:integrase
MASVKIVLRKNQNKDGTYPLVIRITKDRKTTYLSLGHSILLEDWNAKTSRVKKSHPNSARLNNLLAKKLAEANDKLLELETNAKDTTVRTIRKAVKANKVASFFDQAKTHLENLKKEGKYNRLTTDRPKINRLREFIGSDAPFSEIDTELLKRFKAWLKGSRGVSERTAVNHLVVVRSIFNQAISSGLVDRKFYPFGKGRIIIKFPDTVKVGLSAEEVHLLENIELTGLEHHARNLWLFSLYTAGMRISDALRLRWSDIYGERLHYSMGKNNKAGSIKLPDKALKLPGSLSPG